MKKVGLAFTFLCICLLTSIESHAGTNFMPGYIIDFHNDTIHGLIDYQDWTRNPDLVGFKLGKKQSTFNYRPSDLVGFCVMGKQYVGAVVQKETSPYKDGELELDPTLHLSTDTVFLQTLFDGEKSLYYLMEWNGKEQFYIKEDSSYTLLLHKTYLENISGNARKEFHNMRYIGQLTRYFWDNPTLLERIANTYYSRTDLESLFYHYFKLIDNKSAYLNSDGKVTTSFGLVAGAALTRLEMETVYYIASYKPSVDFTGGVSLDLAMTGRFNQWSLYNELLYSSYKTSSHSELFYPSNDAIFELKYLKFNSMARFRYAFFFLNAGFSNGFCIKHYSTEFNDIRKYEIGILAGAGIKYKRFSLEFREEIGDGMSPYVGVYTKTNRHQILLGYRF